jgi:phosphoribosylamine-glycine ligase
VLAVTGIGFDLAEARAAAYDHMERIHFDGMQVRRDIGWRALGAELTSYALPASTSTRAPERSAR